MYEEEYSGYCHYREANHAIMVTYAVNQFLGSNIRSGIPTGFRCEYQNKCRYAQQCSVFANCENDEHIL